MKSPLPNLLGAIIRDYFTDHLPRLRGTSPHTMEQRSHGPELAGIPVGPRNVELEIQAGSDLCTFAFQLHITDSFTLTDQEISFRIRYHGNVMTLRTVVEPCRVFIAKHRIDRFQASLLRIIN